MFTQTIRASRQFLVCALLVASFVLSASGQNQTIFTDVHHDVSLAFARSGDTRSWIDCRRN